MALTNSTISVPLAKDDLFNNLGITEDTKGYVELDVMDNDGGGNAVSLKAISFTNPDGVQKTLSYPSYSLNTEYGKISFSNGVVFYQVNSYAEIFNTLDAGATVDDSFEYTIQLKNGLTSTATATIVIQCMDEQSAATSVSTYTTTDTTDVTLTGISSEVYA